MKQSIKIISLIVGSAAFALQGAEPAAKSDPLLELLIKKGILSDSEAKQVQAEAQNQTPAQDASKWKINSGIKSIELFGDLRFRFEHREAQTATSDTYARDRYRYSARIGLRGTLFDQFYYGFRLDTSQNPRSAWVSFGDENNYPFPGPSSKASDGINIGQVYLGWKPADFTFQVGKMANPLYTTSMVWDPDINPEGLSESYKHKIGEFELFATAGQFLYQDTNPDNPVPGIVGSGPDKADAFLLAFQIGINYQFAPRYSAKLAPTFYLYTGHGQNAGFNGTFVGEGTPAGANIYDPTAAGFINQSGINNLKVLEFPGEFNFPVSSLQGKLFGDLALNLEGSDRARRAGFPQYDDENLAYQIGIAVGKLGSSGQLNQKHAWEARTYWQHVEQYALDVNLLDSDFFEGRGNIEGIFAAFSYALTDSITGTLRYGYGDRINDKLGTGGSNQDLPQLNPITKYQLMQLDLGWKF